MREEKNKFNALFCDLFEKNRSLKKELMILEKSNSKVIEKLFSNQNTPKTIEKIKKGLSVDLSSLYQKTRHKGIGTSISKMLKRNKNKDKLLNIEKEGNFQSNKFIQTVR